MTFYVTQREAEDRGSPRQTGRGSGPGSALRPGPALLPGPDYRQFVVIASGLNWAAVLVAFVGNPGTGREAVSSAMGSASLPAGAMARWSRSAPPSCRWAWPSRRSEAIPRASVAADGARSCRAVGRPAGVACPVAAGSGRARRQAWASSVPACPGLCVSSWVHLGSLRPGAGVARAGADSRVLRRGPGGLRPRPGPLAYTSCNSRVGNAMQDEHRLPGHDA
jgi:hypothetical protein